MKNFLTLRTKDFVLMATPSVETPRAPVTPLHPAEEQLIRYIRELRYGTITRLIVQNGLPQIAEQVTQQVKFTT